MIAINLQTSFLTPPFGFALFYLRSVAPTQAFIDRVTRRRIEGISTAQIYRGSIAFVIIQITLLGLLIAFPELVTGNLDKPVEVDLDTIRITPSGGWGNDSGWGDAGRERPLRHLGPTGCVGLRSGKSNHSGSDSCKPRCA
jgi:hypothetical protein